MQILTEAAGKGKLAPSLDGALLTGRTALTIRCSRDEAAILRAQAAAEHRTISGCLLNILERSLQFEEDYRGELTSLIYAEALIPPARPATKILLRCSVRQADRIRTAAVRRKASISKFVVFSLRRHWKAKATFASRRIPVGGTH